MRNRCKTLSRDHSVLEVTLKTCPRHYSVSAVPETLTVRGPNRPPINGGESDLRGICSIQVDNRYFSFNLFGLTSVKSQESTGVSSCRSISKQILNRGYNSFKLREEGQKDLQLPRFSTQMLDHKFSK